jgi:soluble lytic murein transglycosylase
MKRLAVTIGLVLAAWTSVSVPQTHRRRSVATSADPVVQAYGAAHLSRLAHSTGNLLLEQILLRRVILDGPDKIASGARHRLAENAIESGNYAGAIRLLSTGGMAPVSNASVSQIRRDRALLADAYRVAGENGEALRILNDLLAKTPNPDQPDDADLAAVTSLDEIDGGSDLGEAEHLRRANVYQSNRYWAEARRHFEIVQTPPFAADAMFQIGRGYAQSLNFVEAITWYERVIEQSPDSSAAKDALLQLASAYARVGKTKEAFSRYQAFIDKYPQDEKVDRAYLNVIDIRRDLGDDSEAIKWCGKTEDAFRGKLPEALAIFDEAKIYTSKEDWPDAIAALDRLKQMPDLGGAAVAGGTTATEIEFMRAYASEKGGSRDHASSGYLGIDDGWNTFYGSLATDRLKELGIERTEPDLKALKHGLLSALPPSDMSFDDGTHANARLTFAERTLPKIEPTYPLRAIPREYLMVLYPVPYSASLVRHASHRNVDPRLLLAIMRQESRFDPQARSNAAARGLMQFTHPSAQRIANELGWADFDDDELYSADVSIELAAQYVADLFRMFPDQEEAVVAAYNGGEDNVKRWLERSHASEPEQYVPELVYGQTKDYVQRVMPSYRVYQFLYDEQLKPR